MRSTFSNTEGSALRYILQMAVISLVPSLLISFMFFGVLGVPLDQAPQFDGPLPVLLVSVLVIAPVIETLLMALVIKLVSFIFKKTVSICLATALVWAILHSVSVPLQGVTVYWPFFVFSYAYLAWREHGWWKAIGIATAIHACQNVLPAIAIVVEMTT